jgi:DnaK suppressor protein
MAGQKTLSQEDVEAFRERLRDMRDRLLGQVDQGMEEILGELNSAGQLSTTPVHIGDAAPGQLDADITVFETGRDILQQVQDALNRIDDGSFGICVDCGSIIPVERLRQIPYTACCIDCIDSHNDDSQDQYQTARPVRLTGFEAIEFAEKEGFKLNKSADNIDDAAEGLSIAEAEAIASDNPDLIWLEVSSDDYGVRKNMRPGR